MTPRSAPVRPARRATPAPPTRRKAAIRPGVGAAAAAVAGSAIGTALALNVSRAHPDISFDVNALQSDLTDLQTRASFSNLQTDVAELDASLSHALDLLESARDKGYTYQADLEDIAYQAANRWEEVYNQVMDDIEQQANVWENNINPFHQKVSRLNSSIASTSASGMVSDIQRDVDRALSNIDSAERKIEAIYTDIEGQVRELNSRLTTIHWALDQASEASFDFQDNEDLVMAVKARWDQEGKDDPEGILFLTNQNLIFERKEKVATKKVLFVTTASELVQEAMIHSSLAEINEVKGRNKGVFGHQDFIDVTFTDKQLGKVPFHIDGQDSDKWMRLINDAKSGKIEEDRATGSGLSFSDLTGELTTANIMEIQNEVNELQDEMMLKENIAELSELENEVHSLERDLADLRSRGYVVEKSLEADIEILSSQWEQIKQRADSTIAHQTNVLADKMKDIQSKMSQLAGMTSNLTTARPLYVQLKSAIASAEAQAEAAEQTVFDQYDEYADEIETLDAHLDWVDWMLNALSTASFKLLATESGVGATEAVWERPGLEPENGILYLTDQRLLWEDRVGDYELKVDVPLTEIEGVKEEEDDDKGVDFLIVSFVSGSAPVTEGRFRLALPVADMWLQMIGRARSGDYTQDRAVEVDQAELDRIRNAPQECSACGGAFTAPVLRGQYDITCEFCGTVTRI
jgi:predicted  nucleic acid-binding Zn-ribbon protein